MSADQRKVREKGDIQNGIQPKWRLEAIFWVGTVLELFATMALKQRTKIADTLLFQGNIKAQTG
jgi:hypothetical protein